MLILITSCSSKKKAIANEAVLFPNKSENKIWLINTLSKNSNKNNIHHCLLILYNQVFDKKYITRFSSSFSLLDTVYTYESSVAETPLLNFKPYFPLKIRVPQTIDSTISDWRFVLTRNKIKHDALKITYNNQIPYSFFKTIDDNDVFSAPFITCKTNTNNSVNDSSLLSINIFNKPNSVFTNKANSYLCWINLFFYNNKQLNVLLQISDTKDVMLKGYFLYDSLGLKITNQNLTLTLNQTPYWKSNLSGKLYPLSFKLKGVDDSLEYDINPIIKNQEIISKKNSFWMGAINLSTQKSNKTIGTGNMYIFKN